MQIRKIHKSDGLGLVVSYLWERLAWPHGALRISIDYQRLVRIFSRGHQEK